MLIIVMSVASVLLAGQVGDSSAQNSTTLDVDSFWERLDQTRDLAERASGQTGELRAEYLTRITHWWTPVQQVRLAGDRVIQVNTDWLQIDQGATDEELRALVARIDALFVFRSEHGDTQLDADAMLAILAQVMQDERFQYRRIQPADASSGQSYPAELNEPTERISRSPDSGSSGDAIPAGFAQIVLMITGGLVVLVFAYMLWRTLRVQPASIELIQDEDDIPPTSDAATDRAAQAQTHQDYRAAIRYLYLASLLYLDERGIIRFDPALTNYEHVRQLTRQSPTRSLLVEIVAIFDRVWYGFAPVDEALYQHFRQLIDRLKQVPIPYETTY